MSLGLSLESLLGLIIKLNATPEAEADEAATINFIYVDSNQRKMFSLDNCPLWRLLSWQSVQLLDSTLFVRLSFSSFARCVFAFASLNSCIAASSACRIKIITFISMSVRVRLAQLSSCRVADQHWLTASSCQARLNWRLAMALQRISTLASVSLERGRSGGGGCLGCTVQSSCLLCTRLQRVMGHWLSSTGVARRD